MRFSNKITLLVILHCFSLVGFSQGEFNKWYFGRGAGLDFNPGIPVAMTNAAPSFWSQYPNITVSDSLGNLLFYASDQLVYDKNHQIMYYGSLGNYARGFQPLFVVKTLSDDHTYFIFTSDGPNYSPSKGLCSSLLDMNLNGGLGDLVFAERWKPVPGALFTANALHGTRHRNNRDVWIVTRTYMNGDDYLAYLITAFGIDTIPIVSQSSIQGANPNYAFQVKISPDGSKMVGIYVDHAEFCNFNTTTGHVEPLFRFACGIYPVIGAQTTCEFSVDSRYLYMHGPWSSSGGGIGQVYQYDASLTDSAQFKQSEVLLATVQDYGCLQLGPDGKIYSMQEEATDMDVINNPSLPGTACNYQAHAIILNGNYGYNGLPQLLQRYKAYIHDTGHCFMDTTHFSPDIWPPPDSIHWDFGDPASGAFNFSNMVFSQHRFTNAGAYTVKLFVRYKDNRSDSTIKVVNIHARPVPVITGYPSAIAGSIYTYATEPGMTNYQWTFSPGGTWMSGGGPTDATIVIRWSSPGPQWVRVSYTDANGCEAIMPTQKDIMVYLSFLISFTAPDTVCTGDPVTISNLSEGGSTWDWSFCSGHAGETPTSVNIGNPANQLDGPTSITLVREGDHCYSVIGITETLSSSMLKYDHGSSFLNDPVGWIVPYGYQVLPSTNNDGVQVKFDSLAGNWLGFVTNDSIIWRLNIGPSLGTLWISSQSIGPNPMLKKAHGIQIVKEGNTWIGLIVCRQSNNLVRLNFGINLSNLNPFFTDFGNVAGFNGPTAMQLMKENGNWYAIISAGNNSLARVDFGNSLLNTPTGTNLGNPGGFNNEQGIAMTQDCGETNGTFTNMILNGEVGQLTFPQGLTGPINGQSLGNIGALSEPYAVSEIVREDDTLVAYVVNKGTSTLTRLTWLPCSAASIPSSTQFNPPPFTYSQPGTYRINLLVDRGMPTQANLCKEIVVQPGIAVDLGADHTVCENTIVNLDAGPGYMGYIWSTGATTQAIQAAMAGSYWVRVAQDGCQASDTVQVNWIPLVPVSITISSTATTVCSGTLVTFTATATNGGANPGYQWRVNAWNASNATNASYTYTPTNGDVVTCILTSTFTNCTTNNPATSNSVTMVVTTSLPAGVSIAASANPFCEGTSVTYTTTPVNGGSAPAYQWQVNAGNAINANNAVFTYTPVNGDVVTCLLTSSASCITGNPAISNSIVMAAAVTPAVVFTPCNDVITTLNAKPFKLKGGRPIGGTYSGPGVTAATGIFNPLAAGNGIKTIRYTYTNIATCSDFKTITITVQPTPMFNCGNLLTDVRDGKQYKTFSLPNGKCWMQENLDFGTTISDLTPQTDNCTPENFAHTSSFVTRTSYFQWDELMTYDPTPGAQGLCPPGWHVPTAAEWDELLVYNTGAGQAGGPMKDSILVNGFHSHQQGLFYLNNTWAFTSGLYAGSMYWTSTTSGAGRAVARGLNDKNQSVSRYEAARGNGLSVRCLKDQP